MTPREAVLLTRYVKACCPQQQVDEYTPDAWHDLLGDLDLDECRQAAAAIARRQPFVAPAEIRAEVRRLRDDRISRLPLPAPSPDEAVDPRVYRDRLAEIVQRAGDGRMPFKAITAGRGAEPSDEFKAARSTADNDRVLAQTVACPVEWCPARVGEPCRPSPTQDPMPTFHPSRLQVARGEEPQLANETPDQDGGEPSGEAAS